HALPLSPSLRHLLRFLAVDPRDLHSFPTRRSSDLQLSGEKLEQDKADRGDHEAAGDGKTVSAAHAGILFCAVVKSNNGLGALRRSEEHTSELQSRFDLVCRLLLEKKKQQDNMLDTV